MAPTNYLLLCAALYHYPKIFFYLYSTAEPAGPWSLEHVLLLTAVRVY